MQKIIITNFGAIKAAEIELKKVLILIGEQASGKSTIAKLIYFFKSLRDDLFSQIYNDDKKEYFDISEDLNLLIRNKFYALFGTTLHLPDFEIRFYYSLEKGKYLDLTLDSNKQLKVAFSNNFIEESFIEALTESKELLKEELAVRTLLKGWKIETSNLKYANRLSILVNQLFESNQMDTQFIIAGRNATVSYSDLFEKYLFASVQKSVADNITGSNKYSKQTIDETLMLKFMEKVMTIKEVFKNNRNFEDLIETYTNSEEYKAELYAVKAKIDLILKGKYIVDSNGEKLIHNEATGEYVFLSNASSGQQESIRILQDIFLNILDNTIVFRILEEPEAHLFPVAQKHMIELLAQMINQHESNQLIITTHSPYVLTVFNNLLFANRVVKKNPGLEQEVAQIIDKAYWLELSDFAAYSLGNSEQGESTPYCTSIINQTTGLIDQNYLDEVSEMLSGDFNALYKIHSKTFARK